MNYIYAYSTETYDMYRGWLKVGLHAGNDPDGRISQQDSTSNPESLNKKYLRQVPTHITDKDVHEVLRSMGRKEVRLDKSREWFECTTNDIDTAINDILYGVARPNSYPMRDEQKDCHDQVVNHFINGGEKFLINAKMRYGKTFTVYNIMKTMKVRRALVLTYKPAVDSSWREDLESHIDFDGWTYNTSKEFSASNPIVLNGDGVEILFASFQDINDFNKAKWVNAINYHYDMVVVDEMHYGSDTDRAKASLSRLSFDHILYVSGTPLKELLGGAFMEDEIYSWGYADEQAKRQLEKDSGWQTEVYRWLPQMEFHTYTVSDEAKKILAAYTEDEGFTMTKMFGSDDGEEFLERGAVKLFLDQVFGINVRAKQSPVKQFASDHILMVMPPSVNSVNAMANVLDQRVGDDYHIINVAGNNISQLDYVKRLIGHHKKTITVTCGRFNTGVTVPEWDMVLMLEDGLSAETYFQTVFRVQSPDKNRGKEVCYVVDFNPQRTIQVIYEYANLTAKKKQSAEQSLREFLEFAPVLDHSDNRPVRVSVDDVLSKMIDIGGLESQFSSQSLFNWSNSPTDMGIFGKIQKFCKDKKMMEVSDNDLIKGKNYETEDRDSGPKQKNEERELRQLAISMTRRIPYYLFLETGRIGSTVEIITVGDEDLFETVVRVSKDQFRHMMDTKFINQDRLDRCIGALTLQMEEV